MPAHRLGPHVVGHRVVVRRVLEGETGPSGGPALTDVLGVCLAWADGVCVVQPDDASFAPVRIAVADIVSGKPVPPRASPRLRVSPAEAQRRGMTLFAGLQTVELGGWTLRRSPAHSARRANSVLAMAPAGVADAYERVVSFYEGFGQRPIAAVLRGSAEEAVFLDHAWVPESPDGDTVFEMAGVAAVRRALGSRSTADVDVAVVERGELATARIGGRASGVAALDDDWVGFRSIAVAPEHRRQGLGLAVMAALIDWGAERGATTAYLQVLGDNPPALALYDRLGFVRHHSYRYLAATHP